MIGSRPDAADKRSEQGHWERDLVIGQISGPALLVIQDRKTRYVIIRKVLNKTCAEVDRVTREALKDQKVLSTTNDNGIEFGNYEKLETELRAPIYFCHPYTSSERGTVENTNGLIRQYFPKGYDLSQATEEQISYVESEINLRPKKVLGYRCPEEVHEGKILKMVLSKRTYKKHYDARNLASYIHNMKMGLGY
jgi:IS30 family transposase